MRGALEIVLIFSQDIIGKCPRVMLGEDWAPEVPS